eukprot:TRINITY_DN11061_c0_g1_i1.p1 TRINITY_DN11061_c0_g1~~TRINITY_DN11061_c0_g1_i1.p1  ORF type:complete len:370 (+),score=74.88 TRINITY_DN11061_c0_g1_i1:859-1968(+)
MVVIQNVNSEVGAKDSSFHSRSLGHQRPKHRTMLGAIRLLSSPTATTTSSSTMDMQEAMLEERYAVARGQLFQMMKASSGLNVNVLKAFNEVFREESDCTKHGPVLWALMTKGTGVKRGVLGSHFRVYILYYYHYLILASQRKEYKRSLDSRALAFITCCAAFGYGRGVGEFDRALKAGKLNEVNNVIVDYVHFGKFFWSGNTDSFSWCGSWMIIDTLWQFWDSAEPVKIHGFITGTMSYKMLRSRSKDIGAFCFRFSSQGGLAVDYVAQGELKKVLWKGQAISTTDNFLRNLYDDSRDGKHLKSLIDTSSDAFGPRIHAKTNVFPESGVSYTPTGYSAVTDDIEDRMEEADADSFVSNFMDNSVFGGF